MAEQATGAHPCGCKGGSRIISAEGHARFHALVKEQLGVERGPVDVRLTMAVRGFATATPAMETVLDVRARESGKRASGELRRASRAAEASEVAR